MKTSWSPACLPPHQALGPSEGVTSITSITFFSLPVQLGGKTHHPVGWMRTHVLVPREAERPGELNHQARVGSSGKLQKLTATTGWRGAPLPPALGIHRPLGFVCLECDSLMLQLVTSFSHGSLSPTERLVLAWF